MIDVNEEPTGWETARDKEFSEATLIARGRICSFTCGGKSTRKIEIHKLRGRYYRLSGKLSCWVPKTYLSQVFVTGGAE